MKSLKLLWDRNWEAIQINQWIHQEDHQEVILDLEEWGQDHQAKDHQEWGQDLQVKGLQWLDQVQAQIIQTWDQVLQVEVHHQDTQHTEDPQEAEIIH